MSVKMSDAKPKLRELALELDELSWAEVKAMAIQLDMKFKKLKNIESENKETSDLILNAMEAWLETDPNASWKKIVKALSATDKNALAESIKKNHSPCPSLKTTASEVTATGCGKDTSYIVS